MDNFDGRLENVKPVHSLFVRPKDLEDILFSLYCCVPLKTERPRKMHIRFVVRL